MQLNVAARLCLHEEENIGESDQLVSRNKESECKRLKHKEFIFIGTIARKVAL